MAANGHARLEDGIDNEPNALVVSRTKKKCLFQTTLIEPAPLLFSFGLTLSQVVIQNLFLGQVCSIEMGYNSSVCSNLSAYPVEEAIVQPKTTILLTYKNVIEAALPALASLFLGPWSDHHGRKLLLTLPYFGYAGTYFTFLGLSTFHDLEPQYLLLGSIPIALTGGMATTFTGLFCYISDVTDESKRALRMGVVEATFFVGITLGLVASSYILAWGGYFAVFLISGVSSLLAVIYTAFFLKESVNISVTERRRPCGAFRDFLTIHHVIDMVKTCFKQRRGGRRACIFMILFVLISCILTLEGESTVAYLYTKTKFGWSVHDYTLFNSINSVTVVVGTVIGMLILVKWLKLPEGIVSFIGFSSKVGSSIFVALATHPWMMFIGISFGCVGGVISPMCRSILSKTVSSEELGKVFSLLSSAEALCPLAASSIYTPIYNASLLVFPGAIYLVSASFFALDCVFIVIVSFLIRKKVEDDLGYTTLSNE